ncbi:hypothetical protein C8Q74DRAFT_1305283 [Fomes fomentarius]|nr:hypothetical protein C8Q74DRAFT_1305283 [Fomes fomentarius]
MAAHTEPEHFRVTYQDVHNLIRESAGKIEAFKPDIIIAIGVFPACVMVNAERKGNIPIYAIGLSLYESLPGMTAEQIGAEVIRIQWLRALIVDEVDDSRKTAMSSGVERELALLPEAEREAKCTQFAIFVVHNKIKPNLANLPADHTEIEGVWLDYPREAADIEEHDRLAEEKAKRNAAAA